MSGFCLPAKQDPFLAVVNDKGIWAENEKYAESFHVALARFFADHDDHPARETAMEDPRDHFVRPGTNDWNKGER